MESRELSDEEWAFIKPLLPPKAKTGRPRVNDRMVLNGILYVLITSYRWMDNVAVSGESLPLSVIIGPGDEHDGRRFTEVIDSIRVKHGIGRPRARPKEIHADSAYDTKEIRKYLRRRGIKANMDINPRNGLNQNVKATEAS